jgi:hypothetical protein
VGFLLCARYTFVLTAGTLPWLLAALLPRRVARWLWPLVAIERVLVTVALVLLVLFTNIEVKGGSHKQERGVAVAAARRARCHEEGRPSRRPSRRRGRATRAWITALVAREHDGRPSRPRQGAEPSSSRAPPLPSTRQTAPPRHDRTNRDTGPLLTAPPTRQTVPQHDKPFPPTRPNEPSAQGLFSPLEALARALQPSDAASRLRFSRRMRLRVLLDVHMIALQASAARSLHSSRTHEQTASSRTTSLSCGFLFAPTGRSSPSD